ncbi:amidohydrolase family protein [Paenibacillus massiliensis]|uniref:amidohydrolase family protein n=1 Tax=Paenibacillus massiliensis TaxID=225917 RepID=UPI00046FB8A5|nr:amidohydrolase family protein [Paenibacillus massiliensis]
MSMIIDMHVHLADRRIYPDYWLQGIKDSIRSSILIENGLEVNDDFLDQVMAATLYDTDCSLLIRRMDEAGIDHANLLMADFGIDREDMPTSIDALYQIHAEALRRYPDRFSVFAGVDPRRGQKGLELFQQGVEQFGFCGLKLYPPCGFDLDDPLLYPFYEICEAYRLPVLAHIGPSLPSMRREFRYPGAVLDVASRFRNIPFILGHAALVHYEDSRRLPLHRDNIYLEVSGYQPLLRQGVDLSSRMLDLMHTCGERVLFGTDWPLFSSPREIVRYFQDMKELTDQQKEMLFCENARSIFALRRGVKSKAQKGEAANEL